MGDRIVNYDELRVGTCGMDCEHFETKEEMDAYLENSPKTGDTSLLLWGAIGIIVILILALVNKKRKV